MKELECFSDWVVTTMKPETNEFMGPDRPHYPTDEGVEEWITTP